MLRSYLVIPLIGLLLFGAAYGRYAARYEARLATQKHLDDLAKEEKAHAQEAAIATARTQAEETALRRKQERDAEVQLESTRKAERLTAEQLRLATLEHERRLAAQVERCRSDTTSLETALAALEARRRSLEREKDSLADYVKQAEENRAEYFRLLEKLDAAERARTATVPTPALTSKPPRP